MGMIKLELRCPKEVNGISIDPNPNWNFNDLLSELNTLELNSNDSGSSLELKPFTKTAFREISRIDNMLKKNEEKKKPFVMRVDDDDDDDEMDEFDSNGGAEARSLVPASRFVYNDVYLSDSDDSEDEGMHQLQVMDKFGVVEGAFLEVTHEHQLGVKEEIRNQLAAIEAQLVDEKEKSTSALVQAEKSVDAKRLTDRKLDLLYQRKIAQDLDNHLTAIQRDHEHRSLVEERKIREYAALEEVKRKEKALQEELMRQQKAKEEEEKVRREAAKRVEEERKAAQEAERVAKEAADKLSKEHSARESVIGQIDATLASPLTTSSNLSKEMKSRVLLRAAENALKLEEKRLQICKEIEERNQSITSGSNLDLRPKDREMARRVRQISGSIDAVRSKAKEIVKFFNDSSLPQSVAVEMFAKKITTFDASTCFNGSAFARGLVIVYVSAQVPAVMDCVLAEFHKACIYTVPKHIVYSKTAFENRETYMKAIGYREVDGKMETTDSYLKQLEALMKLYGALVQTEDGLQNPHGLEEGWAWLARFLKALPPNIYTATALHAFLGMAGFALYRKYKSQFRKIMNAISKEFVPALIARGDKNLDPVIKNLQNYLESCKFLEEPAGRSLETSLLSRVCV